MTFKSKYVLTYSADGKKDNLEIIAQIRQRDAKIEDYQCVHECVLFINGSLVKRDDIENYVNAEFAIEDIYEEYKTELKRKHRAEGKSFRTLKENFK